MSNSSTKILIATIAIVIVGIAGTAAWIMSQPKKLQVQSTDSMSTVTMKSKDSKISSMSKMIIDSDISKPTDVNQKEASAIKISMAELAKHNNDKDCYIAYKKEVFDITSFLPNHTGGEKKPLKYCGKVTDNFSEIHSGGNFDEGQVAAMLKPRLIGVLE